MKKTGKIFAAVFLISACFAFQPTGAQDKTDEEKERELKVQAEIEAQKKAITEQKDAQDELIKSMDVQKKNFDLIKDSLKQFEMNPEYNDMARRFAKRYAMPYINNDPFFDMRMDQFINRPFGDEGERTTWDFAKSIKENSFSGDYTFDVEPTVKTVVMAVNGDCKKGDIRIKIIMPDGKVYSDILIDESGNLDWRKSFKISEEENKDKEGAWKFQINASKATGYFKISLQTY